MKKITNHIFFASLKFDYFKNRHHLVLFSIMRPPNIVIFILFNITIDQIFAIITEDEEFEIELKNCGCKRKLKKYSHPANKNSMKNILFNETTCSIDAYNRGIGQKIVGFSLYGDYTMKKL